MTTTVTLEVTAKRPIIITFSSDEAAIVLDGIERRHDQATNTEDQLDAATAGYRLAVMFNAPTTDWVSMGSDAMAQLKADATGYKNCGNMLLDWAVRHFAQEYAGTHYVNHTAAQDEDGTYRIYINSTGGRVDMITVADADIEKQVAEYINNFEKAFFAKA